MSRKKPQQGQQFIVQKDGTVEEIATEAYGDPTKSYLVWGANTLATNTVKRGDALIIPGEPPAVKISGKEADQMTVLIDGIEIPMESVRVVRTMDTGADGWVGTMPWVPGEDRKIDEATRPYGYPRSAVYIGNELVLSGLLYGVQPEFGEGDRGRIKNLSGYSFTADAIDSNVPEPYEYTNVALEQLAAGFAALLGIKAVFLSDSGGAFARVTAGETESIFGFLSKLAAERGLLVSCTNEGNLLFHRALTTGTPVGTVAEGDALVTHWAANYDGRRRYHTYNCIQAGVTNADLRWEVVAPDAVGPVSIKSIDTGVPRSRFMTFRADNVTPGNVEDAARWRKNKQLADALTNELPVSSWYAPNGELWQPNTLLTVVSPTLGVPKGFTFLIRAVEFVQEDRRHAVLHLVPPQAFSRDRDLGDIWTLD